MKRLLIASLLVAVAVSAGCAPEERPVAEPKGVPEPEVGGLETGSFRADLNGVEIHYEVHGSGPVLMTLPNSWGLSLEGLRSIYKPLEKDLTLVYFDPRGMGRSGPIREPADMGLAAVREDFDALRRKLGLERVHAIGWSNGATNLILLASERPDILESAVFLHGSARFQEEDMQVLADRVPDLLPLYGEFVEEMKSGNMTAGEKDRRFKEFSVETFFPYMLADRQAGGVLLREVYENTEFGWAHSEYSEQEMPAYDLRDRLPSITVRSLVITGEHDLLPPDYGREIAEGIAGAEFVLLAESGHFGPIEEPELFRRTLLGFLGVGAP